MEDQDDTGQPAETDEDLPVTDDTEEKPAGEPADEPEPEATPPEKEEPAKPSLDDFPLDELLAREDVKRFTQGVGDRATAKAEALYKERVEKAKRDASAAAEAAERKKLIENEEFDELGRREADKAAAEERLMESLDLAGGVISKVAIERYAKELGEETVQRIVADNDAKDGNIVDLTSSLAAEAARRANEKTTKDAVAEAKKEFSEELEALRAEMGVERRSEKAKETGPVDKVSGSPADASGSEEEKTYDQACDEFNRGDMTLDEFEPYERAHEEGRFK